MDIAIWSMPSLLGEFWLRQDAVAKCCQAKPNRPKACVLLYQNKADRQSMWAILIILYMTVTQNSNWAPFSSSDPSPAVKALNNPFGDKIATGSFDRIARVCLGRTGAFTDWKPLWASIFLSVWNGWLIGRYTWTRHKCCLVQYHGLLQSHSSSGFLVNYNDIWLVGKFSFAWRISLDETTPVSRSCHPNFAKYTKLPAPSLRWDASTGNCIHTLKLWLISGGQGSMWELKVCGLKLLSKTAAHLILSGKGRLPEWMAQEGTKRSKRRMSCWCRNQSFCVNSYHGHEWLPFCWSFTTIPYRL